MSAIAGIFCIDGAAVNEGQLKSLVDSMASRGPDDSGYWISGSIGLGHRMFWTTPESLGESLPLHDHSCGLAFVYDGRIDNRADLSRQLKARGLFVRNNTDA